MEITSYSQDKIRVIAFDGGFDTKGSGEVRAALEPLAEEESIDGIVLDLNNVELLNSSGLGLIVINFKKFREKGKKLALCQLNTRNKEAFALTKLDELIPIFETVQQAVDDMVKP